MGTFNNEYPFEAMYFSGVKLIHYLKEQFLEKEINEARNYSKLFMAQEYDKDAFIDFVGNYNPEQEYKYKFKIMFAAIDGQIDEMFCETKEFNKQYFEKLSFDIMYTIF